MVLPGSVRHQVGVVGGGGVGDSSGAPEDQGLVDALKINKNHENSPAVQMTQVVGEHLQLISSEGAVVPQDLVVAGSAGALDALVTEQVEVSLRRVVDALVHHSPGQSIAVPVFVVVGWEEPEEDKKDIKQSSTKIEIYLDELNLEINQYLKFARMNKES